MSKKVWKITGIVSFLVFLALAVRLVVSLLLVQAPVSPDVAIIGGADAPTAIFVAESILFQDPLFVLLLISFALFVISLVSLLIKRFRKQ